MNEGLMDRVIRIVIGLGILSLVFVGPQSPWGWIGLVPLITGVVGFCPLYKLIGLNTRKYYENLNKEIDLSPCLLLIYLNKELSLSINKCIPKVR